jgi:hypothetical protein
MTMTLWAAAVVVAWAGAPASAQLIYLDVNGDGLPAGAGSPPSTDALGPSTGAVDVYLDTSRDAGGRPVVCPDPSSPQLLTINSYEILLTWSGDGTVRYAGWTNNMPGFWVNGTGGPGGAVTAGRDIWIALGSTTPLPPGRYRLGTLAVSVRGNPVLSWIALGDTWPECGTRFGTMCYGRDFDNTYKLGSDFTDARGTAPAPPAAIATTWGKIETLYR